VEMSFWLLLILQDAKLRRRRQGRRSCMAAVNPTLLDCRASPGCRISHSSVGFLPARCRAGHPTCRPLLLLPPTLINII